MLNGLLQDTLRGIARYSMSHLKILNGPWLGGRDGPGEKGLRVLLRFDLSIQST